MMDRFPITLRVNGTDVKQEVQPRLLLVHLLRQHLDLTGTHIGCETSQCGACVVLLNGEAVKSCTVLAVQADGGEVTTIEGMAPDGELHPIQEAFHREHGLQCGYCTPGMVMCAHEILRYNPDPSEEEIQQALHGNLCRCTGYRTIINAIRAAGADLREKGGQPV